MAEKISKDANEEICFRQRFGWFNFRPNCIQWLNSTKSLLFFLCTYFFANSAVINGIYSTSISTMEKRFNLSSAQMGMITSIYDIAALLFIGPVSYFGIRNKPKSLGLGMLTMGIGYVIFLSPHLIASPYEPDLDTKETSANLTSNLLCTSDLSRNHGKSCNSQAGSNVYYSIFMMAMFVAGAGCSPMISIGIPYLDENVSPKVSPIYVGIFQSSGIVAVIAGFLLSSVFLNIFVHPGQKVNINPKSVSWVGAWWLGFAIGAALSLVISISLFAFPQRLRKVAYEETTAGEKNVVDTESASAISRLKDIPKALKTLLIDNRTYLCTSIAVSLTFFVVSSGTAFITKLAFFQFRLTASQASLYVAVSAVPGALFGNLTGSYLHKRCKLTTTGALKLIVAISLITLTTGLHKFIYCENYPVEGLNTNNAKSSNINRFYAKCSGNCSCESQIFSPVCVADKTYITPCHAGCTGISSIKGFSNCSCSTSFKRGEKEAILGACPSSCGVLPHIFFVFAFFDAFFISLASTPCIMVTLRCVPLHLQSFAMGIQWMMVRVLGSIPGPIVIGYIIDYSCIFWNKICMNSNGSCRMYNNKALAINTGLTFTSMTALILVFFVLALVFESRKKKEEDGGPDTTEMK